MEQEQFEVRIFTVADHAAIPPDGKLYINGGGIVSVMAQPPGQLPPLCLAVRIRVPWHRSSEPHQVSVRLLDADRRPVVHDPISSFTAETGRPPGARPGDELFIQFVVQLVGIPAPPQPATLYFHLAIADHVLSVLPLKVFPPRPQ
ncbi:MAG: hypothetical protein HY332_24715 [Chloroflexi bacterium]|nr:hypothetical protein [Chloroflexota bacterium]